MRKTVATCDVCEAEAIEELGLANGATMDLCPRCAAEPVAAKAREFAKAASALRQNWTLQAKEEAQAKAQVRGAQQGIIGGGLGKLERGLI